ncbi:vitamin K epoxide reductase family protein [Pedobacter sp. GR22-6]|uniref:vitamin K epoxide reductase family protein n=1 Tax=Pedobacter sp. GR22-6 TaxID=3127957 RepID=UPI00307EDC96
MITLSSIFDKPKNDLFNVCKYLFTELKLKFTETALKEQLVEHVEYPSLLSLKDTLFEYGIESAAIRKGKYNYDEFETPFICSIQKEGWPRPLHTVVNLASSDKIEFLDPITNEFSITSFAEFEKMDKDIVLLIDSSNAKDEIDVLKNRKAETHKKISKGILFFIALATIMMSIVAITLQPSSSTSLYGVAFILTSFSGVIVSSMLLWYEIDSHNPFLKEVCGGNKSKLSCSAVLASPASSFLGVSWSIWGFAFFATFFITQVLFPASFIYVSFWSLASISISPYILFSIFYQKKLVKQWCVLCIVIQVILGIDASISVIFLYSHSYAISDISVYSVVIISFVGLSILFVVQRALPLAKAANDSKVYLRKWQNLKYKPEVFLAQLNNSEKIRVSTDGIGVIIGNRNGRNEIVKVCNPYCSPCSKVHPELEGLVTSNPDLRVRIIFTASGEEDDIRTAPVAHLLAIQQVFGSVIFKQALDDWYRSSKKDYKTFAEKYPINDELKHQLAKIQDMNNWCNQMKIRATPTIYVDGNELPDNYSVSELKHFFG